MENKKQIPTLDEWWKNKIATVEKIFEKDKVIAPIAFYLGKDGFEGILPLPFGSEREKVAAIHALGQFGVAFDIKAYCIVSEMYFIKRRHEKGAPFPKELPSQAADRVEGLMLILESELGAKMYVFEIKRDKPEAYLIPANELNEKDGYAEGRLTSILRKRHKDKDE